MDKVIVLTDLGRLVAYKLMTDPDGLESPRIEMIKCIECPEARSRTSDLLSDSAGRFRRAGKADNGTRAGYGERHNMQNESQRRRVKTTADQISTILAAEGRPPWHLAAAKGINNALLDELEPRDKTMLRTNLKADLTNLSKAEVLSRFVN